MIRQLKEYIGKRTKFSEETPSLSKQEFNKLTGIQDSHTRTISEYKNGRLIRTEVNGVSRLTLAGYFDKLFKRSR